MVWVILAGLGVPLWLCAAGVISVVLRNRSLRKRHGDLSVRLRSDDGKRWRRGHALWVHDVLLFRASPAGWTDTVLWVEEALIDAAGPEDRRHLHRLGDEPVIVQLTLHGGGTAQMAAARPAPDDVARLTGPVPVAG
jgi:hypothetical protein